MSEPLEPKCQPDHTHAHDHDHAHGHAHGHSHSHEPGSYGKAFAAGIALNVVFVVVEAVYGILGNSLALLSDAGHNLSDVLGLVIAWAAILLGNKRPSGKRTYGFKSSSILAALFNAVFLLAAVGGIAWEAIQRFRHPAEVSGTTVIIVALIGIVINGATALLFASGRKGDINIKGAFLHMAADAMVSLGVVIAGGIILATGWTWIDPVVSLAICVIIFISTWGLFRESMDLALSAVPKGVDIDAVREYLRSIPTVTDVHDLHIWGMSTTDTALTVHIARSKTDDNDALIQEIEKRLQHDYKIVHSTIQIETGSYSCALAPEDRV
jgi:cobalt-zinc-cadmium efflux system protein